MAKSCRYSDVVNIVICVVILVLGFYFGQYLGHLTGYERMRPIEWDEMEQPTRDRLFDKVKVFCWVATHRVSHKTKARAISVTWGQQCNRIVFVSNATDDELPIIVVKLNESRSELWSKTREAFTWAYNNVLDDYEWFLKADDDTYMHMENLRALLKEYSPDDALAIGHQFKSQGDYPDYHSGGAGYVLSRESVRRLVSEGFANVSACNKPHHSEDVFIGICLKELNITVVDGADENGSYRYS
ncbi:N-acetyllactosaminide 3-alpha-galactosyltransferase [Ancylostoma caninum]|uniref:N-acetylgalactosaminide beta-1,3-galactosyltransferase n=1 Tax=Ancylostoma caninum TaxID=29170 RepID=A0A368GL86_ANCCA|nr:N-acetyllactosaminide 3-alpha-galactosyltransferase [Ancylostoma caninum]